MESLSAYIPLDRRQALVQGKPLPNRSRGAVLFVDISGFTPLTAALARELGPQRGAEELIHQLNCVYGDLIAQVHRYGGSVISFGGDSITCWLDRDNGRRATACALAMQQVMARYAHTTTPGGYSISLAIKAAVAAGQVSRFLVGHSHIQRHEVLAGDIMERVAAAEQLLDSGEVIVGAEVMAWFGERLQIQEWRTDARGEHFAVITGITGIVPPAPWPESPAVSADIAHDWLLPPVYERLSRGEGEFLAQLRPAVALFLKFSGIDFEYDPEAGARLDAYIRWAQTVLDRYSGYLLQLTIGDKGSYLYAAFGVFLSHEENPARAVAAALDLQSPPAGLSFNRQVQIGISQGQMLAGAYGGVTRRTYGVQGNEVNIASRLMNQAQPGQILVTSPVAESTAIHYRFENLGPTRLKGQRDAIPMLALQRKRRKQTAGTLKGLSQAPMIGRNAERDILTAQLQAVRNEGISNTIIIEGEAGIGKSRLVASLLDYAQTLQVLVLLGAGTAIEQTTPYRAWRPIFRELLGVDEREEKEVSWGKVMDHCQDDPELLERISLLNVVLPLQLPETTLTTQMVGEVRADNTNALLIKLLAKTARTTPLLLILEDAHWLDSASWALVEQVKRDVPSALLVVVTRTITAEAVDTAVLNTYKRLRDAPNTRHIFLSQLPAADAASLVRQRLGVESLPPPVAQLIAERAQGHPFFSEELAYALRDTGLIQIQNGRCRLADERADLESLRFPDTIHKAITSRIDRLTPAQQLTLKVASVIGRVFPFPILNDIHPIEADKPHLHEHLQALAQLDITQLQEPEPELTYIFKHTITQEVAYNLLLFAQRRELHKAVAEWYEHTYTSDLSLYYPILAHHWSEAQITAKAIDYLQKAGEEAFHNGAYREAVSFFSQAIALDQEWRQQEEAEAEDTTLPLPAQRLAHWHRLLGEAYHGLGNPVESLRHLQQAVALLNYPYPNTTGGLLWGLFQQIARHVWLMVYPEKWHIKKDQLPPTAKSRLLEATEAYERLTILRYFANETVPALYAAFHHSNLAARLKIPAALFRSYAMMYGIYHLFRLRFGAKIFNRRAQEIAWELEESPALAWGLFVMGGWSIGAAPWPETEEKLAQAIALFQRLGDRRRWGDSMAPLGYVYHFQGRFQEGVALCRALYRLGVESDNIEHQAWGLYGEGGHLLWLGETDEAADLMERASLLFPIIAQSRIGAAITAGSMGVARLRQGREQEARQTADEATELLDQFLPVAFPLFDAYAGTADVYLTLWEQALADGDRAKAAVLQPAARRACMALRRFAWFHPVGRPRAWLSRGIYHWLEGKSRQAHRAWQRGLARAQKAAMPHEEGLAHYEIGRRLPPTDPRRQTHLNQAIEIFTRLETTYDLDRAQTALRHNNG